MMRPGLFPVVQDYLHFLDMALRGGARAQGYMTKAQVAYRTMTTKGRAEADANRTPAHNQLIAGAWAGISRTA
jgi:hypothetical protein